MSRIRGRGNKKTELALLKLLRRNRITGWRRHVRMRGNPDFVFRQQTLAVFVDGCFWHGCRWHGHFPRSNRAFWRRKILSNKQRDKLTTVALRKEGWRVVRIWEHELRDPERCAARIRENLSRRCDSA